MSEPGEVVDVVDAFDDKRQNPFDLHLSAGFSQSWEHSKIRRESYVSPNGQPSTGGFTTDIENIASSSHSTSTLNLGADVGLYHDLALFIHLPIILADDRSLSDLDGSSTAVNKGGRANDPANGQPMFQLPFNSPTRSGIDYIAAGLRWAILSQQRDRSKPTWTVELEGRFSVGTPMHACNANPYALSPAAVAAAGLKSGDQVNYAECPTPGSFNTDATSWYRKPATQDSGQSPGVSRGTNAVKFGTTFSQRYRYVEPYGSFWFMAEFQKANTALGNYSGIDGVIVDHPPLQGGFFTGLMLHPFENREEFQRFSIDLRFKATYISTGQDYSELFDALGSSPAPSLVAPNPASYKGVAGPNGTTQSVGDYSHVVNFTGATQVEGHALFGGSMGFVVQVSPLLRFNAGAGLTYVQAHLISSADACNPNLDGATVANAGRCTTIATSGTSQVAQPTGIPNPNSRAVLDLPGQRFRATETIIWDAWVHGTIMF